nr:Chain U, DNA polymerase kappa [synthetic construct]2ZVL_V Chain V, DNA polymerase kappa [synthetic construct]2ZVL_W Chain W, DNA polymerase kappa [synthetic construct]2ZVL_X Chain X, DNA polymerase kappa [synthetic construct]2ZVL_Y Chain Y, DNA polymerase kappa [synthetic construct]2ZVL_Z Chain Z, DNA polymerase kappa [synthetic construct]
PKHTLDIFFKPLTH